MDDSPKKGQDTPLAIPTNWTRGGVVAQATEVFLALPGGGFRTFFVHGYPPYYVGQDIVLVLEEGVFVACRVVRVTHEIITATTPPHLLIAVWLERR